jgi:hypothetical protein
VANKYLDAAAACIRLADRIADSSRKLKLIDMAQFWMKMGQEAEKKDGRAALPDETSPPLEPPPGCCPNSEAFVLI